MKERKKNYLRFICSRVYSWLCSHKGDFQTIVLLSCQTKTQIPKEYIQFKQQQKQCTLFELWERVDRVTCCIFGFAFHILHTVPSLAESAASTMQSIAYKNYSLSDTCTVYLGFFSHMLCLHLRHKHRHRHTNTHVLSALTARNSYYSDSSGKRDWQEIHTHKNVAK